MTFSYNPAGFEDPAPGQYEGSTKGARWRVRFMIGDVMEITTQANRHLEDEEIDWRVAEWNGDDLSAALACGEDLLGKWAHREVSTVQNQVDSRAEALRKRLDVLRSRNLARAHVAVGGVSVSEKRTADNNPDRDRPSFRRDLLDNPEALQPETTHLENPDRLD